MGQFKILTLNIRGLRKRSKRQTLLHRLKKRECDIIILQETYVDIQASRTWKKEWGGELFATPGTLHSKGNVILFKKSFSAQNVKYVELNDRIQLIKFQLDKSDYLVYNFYNASNDLEKIQCFKDLSLFVSKEIETYTDHLPYVMVLGDCNAVFDPVLDNIKGIPHPARVVKAFQNCMETLELTDVWRHFNRTCKNFTWRKSNPILARRLDYIFVSYNLVSYCSNPVIVHYPMTDHKGVEVTVDPNPIDENLRGPGYFKLNNKVLCEKDFVDGINTVITNTVTQFKEILNPQMLWDFCKVRIVQFAREYCVNRKQKDTSLCQLENELNAAQQKLSDSTDERNSNEYNRLQLKLEAIICEQAEGARIRSKVKWVEQGERSTSYFLNLEKSRAHNKSIKKLISDDGTHLTDQSEIGNHILNFYESLYSKKENRTENLASFIDGVELPKLTNEERDSLEGVLSVGECSKAIKNMKNDSSPGPDGLGAAFYKTFWNKINVLVTDSLNYAFNIEGKLSVSQRKAVITLMHKGKDLSREKITNYRPLSLTNVDYKIGAKCLATRLQSIISSVVHTDQTAYIKGRGIAQNIRLIDDLLWFAREHHLDGILLALDFAKAFDSIDKGYIIKVFKFLNFGEDFIKWLEVFNTGTLSSVLYNGWLTKFFNVESGIRQGCPLSALLFVVALEILSCKIRSSVNVHGVSLRTEIDAREVKITQYADDMTLFLDSTKSFNSVLEIIEEFGRISGLLVNYNKSEAMWIGNRRNNTHRPGKVKWLIGNKATVKILGVHFSNSEEASKIMLNWNGKLEKMRNIIASWRQRQLTIPGKICLIKSLIASQMLHLLATLVIPSDVLETVNTMFYDFIWYGKDRVKRKLLIQNYDTGGLKMFDIDLYRKKMLCKCVKNIVSDTHGTMSCYLAKLILNSTVQHLLILRFNTSISNVYRHIPGLSKLPIFYDALLKAWYETKRIDDTVQSNDVFWLNDNILYKRKTLFFKKWLENDYVFVEDFVQNNALLSEIQVVHRLRQLPDFILKYHLLKVVFSKLEWVKCNLPARLKPIEINRCEISMCTGNSFQKWLYPNSQEHVIKQRFWETKFDSVIDWNYTWCLSFKLKLDPMCCELQWKILQNIYPTAILLQKMGKVTNNKCKYCNQIEFIEHFFASCTVVKPLWAHVQSIYNGVYGKLVHLTTKDIMLGYEHQSFSEFSFLNKLIIVAKLCISKYKYGEYSNLIVLFDRECRIRKLM